MRVDQFEIKLAVLFTVLFEGRAGRACSFGMALRACRAGQGAQAHGVSQLFDERGGQLTCFGRAFEQNGIDRGGVVDQLFVFGTHGRNFAVNAFKQHLFGVTPANAIGIGLGQAGGFFGAGKGLVNLKQGRAFGIFGFARCA